MSAPPDAPAGGDGFTRRRLAWLEAVAETPGLPVTAYRIAAKIALRYLSRNRGFAWPAIATLGADLQADKKAVLKGIAALEGAGHLAVVRSRGRGHANEYRLQTPSEKVVKSPPFTEQEKVVDTPPIADAKGGDLASEKVVKSPPQPIEEPIEGAGAHSARPAPHPCEVLRREVGHTEQARALERAPLSPSSASDENLGRPVTFSDLDRLAAEEWAAANTPRALAAAALADLPTCPLPDPAFFVGELIAGFLEADEEAVEYCAESIAFRMLQARRDARLVWSRHRDVALELFRAIAPDRADDALDALRAAVRVAGEAEKASRKAAEHEDTTTAAIEEGAANA